MRATRSQKRKDASQAPVNDTKKRNKKEGNPVASRAESQASGSSGSSTGPGNADSSKASGSNGCGGTRNVLSIQGSKPSSEELERRQTEAVKAAVEKATEAAAATQAEAVKAAVEKATAAAAAAQAEAVKAAVESARAGAAVEQAEAVKTAVVRARAAAAAARTEAVKAAVEKATAAAAVKQAEAVQTAVESARAAPAAAQAEAVKAAVESARAAPAAAQAEAVKAAVESARAAAAVEKAEAVKTAVESAKAAAEVEKAEAVKLAAEDARAAEIARREEAVRIVVQENSAAQAAKLAEAVRLAVDEAKAAEATMWAGTHARRSKKCFDAWTQTTLSTTDLQAVATVALHGETQEQLEAAVDSLKDRPALSEFVKGALQNPLVKEFLMGRTGLGDVFMQPSMCFVPISPELRREVSKPLTWPRLFAKGKRALKPETLSKLLGLLDSENGRKVFTVLFTFLGGVVLRPHPEHLHIPAQIENVLKDTLKLPAEYKGVITELDKGSKSFSCPLCGIIQISTNAKQHIVTAKCVKFSSITNEMRQTVALEIKSNRFVIQEAQLVELDRFLTQTDQVSLRVILLCIGGVILNSDFAPIGLYSVVNHPTS